ncbi:GNAT family N-acetyltransferase [Brevibacillus reuszeri]|uniref:GNAT family N-acetyltransferase n=1 Tax=Brevibacillus reuszeri TaxID=54915 RepID=UPI000A961A48|nr:GNAT family N-acetyltransferase [Brevibacillus reuszeri]MED1861065.1 GNAT family N-acetyltransferase [Brevibacillus reuszeri]
MDDVFILPSHQGRGLAKWLVSVIVEHPELKHLNRFLLATRDAHGLYAQYGFQPTRPAVYMEKLHKSHPNRSVNP